MVVAAEWSQHGLTPQVDADAEDCSAPHSSKNGHGGPFEDQKALQPRYTLCHHWLALLSE